MESLDAIGNTRKSVLTVAEKGSKYWTTVVDQADVGDGTVIKGIEGLQQHILTKKQTDFKRGLVRYLYSFMAHTTPSYKDAPQISTIVKSTDSDLFTIQSLFENLTHTLYHEN
jgi:hypothetical protein